MLYKRYLYQKRRLNVQLITANYTNTVHHILDRIHGGCLVTALQIILGIVIELNAFLSLVHTNNQHLAKHL